MMAAYLGREVARSDLTELLRGWEQIGWIDGVSLILPFLGFLELSLGNAAEAHRHLSRATSMFLDAGILEPGLGFFLPDQIEALVRLGRPGEAWELNDWLEERGATLDRARARATAGRGRALVLAAEGDLASAEEAAAAAILEHDRLPVPFERARTLLVLGSVRRRMKQKRSARATLDEALRIFEHLGAALWAGRARSELASIGGRAPQAGALTPTEERVAMLAAAGRTNREIAETLFLSVRTVESHLSHAYQKIGVRSRTELALVLEPSATT
jgi:DNA-binding NarL/FixJ family response regulator